MGNGKASAAGIVKLSGIARVSLKVLQKRRYLIDRGALFIIIVLDAQYQLSVSQDAWAVVVRNWLSIMYIDYQKLHQTFSNMRLWTQFFTNNSISA